MMLDKGMSFKLRRKIVSAKKRLNDARDGIIMQEYAYILPPCKERQFKTCINKFDNVVDVVDKTSGPGFVAFCENFDIDLPCCDTQCPYHKDNMEYIKTNAEYQEALAKYNMFRFSKILGDMVKG